MGMDCTAQPMIGETESLAFIDQTLISGIEFRLRHLHATKKKEKKTKQNRATTEACNFVKDGR